MSVASLEWKLTELRNKRRILENRKKAVEEVIKKDRRKPPDDFDSFVRRVSELAHSLDDAVIGSNRIRMIEEECLLKARNGCGLGDFSERDYLDREVNRLVQEIDDIAQEILNTESQLSDARQAELGNIFNPAADAYS